MEKNRSDLTLLTDGAVSALKERVKSAGAFTLRGMGIDLKGSRSAGDFASSFTAELTAITEGLRTALGCLLQMPNVDGKSITVGSDSLSVLRALQRGPQMKSAVYPLWNSLGQLLNMGVTIRFVYLPAHCAYGPHEEVDKLAKEQMSSNSNIPVLLGDEVRFHMKKLLEEVEEGARRQSSFRAELLKGHSWHITSDPPKMYRQEARLLHQMRVGAVFLLGGWRHDMPEPCPYCHAEEALGRGGTAVKHIFECPASPWPQRRTELEIKDLSVLVHQPMRAVTYAKEFVAQINA